jgi:hypothetical protein
MTAAVEVLQVEGVVPRLVEIATLVLCLANLKLQNNYDIVGNYDSIDPAANPRDDEL